VVIGGTQDNGTVQSRSSGTVWDWVRDGDGGTVDIDPTDEKTLYAMYQYASSISKQTNGGAWQPLNANLQMTSTCFNLHVQVHPGQPTTMLASCTSLWRTTTTQPPGGIHNGLAIRVAQLPTKTKRPKGATGPSTVDASTEPRV
jgi:hypothetical protein